MRKSENDFSDRLQSGRLSANVNADNAKQDFALITDDRIMSTVIFVKALKFISMTVTVDE